VPDLAREVGQLVLGQPAEVPRPGDRLEQRHGGEATGPVLPRRAQSVCTATAGSCRLPIQTRPSCSRTPVTMWYDVPCRAGSTSTSCTRRPWSSYACTRTVCCG